MFFNFWTSYWTRWTSCLNPQAGSSSLQQANSSALQPFSRLFHHSTAMADSFHPSNPQSISTQAAHWFPPHFHYFSPDQSNGENHRSPFPPFSIPVPLSFIVILEPVCVQADRISSSCNHFTPSQYQQSNYKSICHSHIPRFQQGVWHGASLHSAGEVGPTGHSRRSLQLTGRLLQGSLAQHSLSWSVVHQCKSYTGLMHRTGIVMSSTLATSKLWHPETT